MVLRVELLDISVHTTTSFTNSDPAIEAFIKTRANKEHRLGLSETYVIIDSDQPEKILGYFTLSPHSVLVTETPHQLLKELPKYPQLPTYLLGRLGRNTSSTPKGFGKLIVKEALTKIKEKGSFFAVELHAKNEKLVNYYKNFGFVQLIDDRTHMILPRAVLLQLITK